MRIKFFTWVISIITAHLIIFYISTIPQVHSQCLEDQRSLLLQLKANLKFDSSISTKLLNWNNQSTDCCQWSGVACDEAGRVVTGLDLSSESISGGLGRTSSLFRLKFLERLNLANNSFNLKLQLQLGTTLQFPTDDSTTSLNLKRIPSSFGNLTSLTYLNLSNAGFAGKIPFGLSRLTRLVTLDLSTLYFPGTLPLQLENADFLRLLQNLTELTDLRLDGVNISARGPEWGKAISFSLPNLRVLSLSSCYLSGPIDSSLLKLQFLSEIYLVRNNLSSPVPEFIANFSNLTTLRLSSSNLYGDFPKKILLLPTLQTLRLEDNKLLQGSLPQFPQNGSLQTLILSDTNFSGTLPDSIGNLRNLSRIEISFCHFSGSIPISMENLSQLVYLDLSGNNFTGPVPSFQMSKNLRYIDLSHNALTGPVPSSHFEGLSNLINIDLAHNSLNGSVPSSLFSLPSLQKIQLSNNHFSGQIVGFPEASLPPLDTLDLSSNKLEGPIPTSFFDFSRLSILSLSFNKFNGTIQLERFQKLQNLSRLELSYNSLSIITGESSSSLSSFPPLGTLGLASCKLQNFPALMNQSIMIRLDLSDNQISGEIPNWIWNVGNGSLAYLNLSHNLLVELQSQYTIPSFLGVLDLHSNQLRGEIPLPPEFAIYLDYSSNNFSSSIPAEIGKNLNYAIFFSLSNNSLTGAIPQSICDGWGLQVLDLSSNRLSGSLPQCLIEKSTETIGILNLRNNNLTGHISGIFPVGCALKTLDLNGNYLEGRVPESLTNCTRLEVLNLGNNRITDNFPCFMENSSSLSVLVLRFNKFQGDIRCQGVNNNNTWPKLQIIDLALNNFTGVLPPKPFLDWKAMMVDGRNAQSDLNGHLRFEFLKLNNLYYQDTVTVTNKGLEMKLVKILTIFTSIDLSSNGFEGEIPSRIGDLSSLYVLNLSHNALIGEIPSSLGNLTQLGSLDLSSNKLSGSIPITLARLTFLSFLNLSYNQLVGKIPGGSQFQTFSEASFEGNGGLCGPPLNTGCRDAKAPGSPPLPPEDWHSDSETDDDIYICAAVGFVVGLGSFIAALAFCKRWNQLYYKHVDQVLESIFHLEERQTRRIRRRRAYRNPIRGI